MRTSVASLTLPVTVISLACLAHGETVEVTATGSVEFNQISAAPLGNVNAGDAVTMTFEVDSNVFVNNPNFPVRAYEIDQSSFSMTLGTTVIGLQSPFPGGATPYFAIRNDDPAVDGFFVSTDIDGPIGVPLAQTGLFEQFRDNYYVTYGGSTLSSLDILDALGTYDFTGLTVFNWTIDDGPFNAMGMIIQQLTLSTAVGTASCFGIFCPCANDDSSAGCANSTGSGGLLGGSGSTSVAADALLLDATQLPPMNNGLFYMGDTQVQAPFFDGFQCALGTTFRFLGSIQNTGAGGTMTLGPGIVADSGALITAGSTWHFHAWHRDVPGSPCGTGANLTNLFSVTFTP